MHDNFNSKRILTTYYKLTAHCRKENHALHFEKKYVFTAENIQRWCQFKQLNDLLTYLLTYLHSVLTALLTSCTLDLDALRQNVQMCVGLIGACVVSSDAAAEGSR